MKILEALLGKRKKIFNVSLLYLVLFKNGKTGLTGVRYTQSNSSSSCKIFRISVHVLAQYCVIWRSQGQNRELKCKVTLHLETAEPG